MKKRYDEELAGEMTHRAGMDVVPAFIEFFCDHAAECGYSAEKTADMKRAVEEALLNILRFACQSEDSEIKVSCGTHDSGGLRVTITDTGVPFNVLLASVFPEDEEFAHSEIKPSATVMKRVAEDIEYHRTASENILIISMRKER